MSLVGSRSSRSCRSAAEPSQGSGPCRPTDSTAAVDTVRERACHLFEVARGSHDWDHTLRVVRLCRKIGSILSADMDVLISAAYLHDIGRCYQDASNGAVCHAAKGADMAGDILADIPLSASQKKNIIHCVRAHRFRGTVPPETIEAQILFDADKLDAIGAVGVARAFLFAGEVGARLHNASLDITHTKAYSQEDTGYREYKLKLSKIRARMLTPVGQQIAADRHAFMENFFTRFLDEHEGKR